MAETQEIVINKDNVLQMLHEAYERERILIEEKNELKNRVNYYRTQYLKFEKQHKNCKKFSAGLCTRIHNVQVRNRELLAENNGLMKEIDNGFKK